MKVYSLIARFTILPLALLILYAACPSLAQPANNSSMNASAEENASIEEQVPASANASESGAVPDLSYIWSVSGIEPGQVIMALNQENGTLYGQAKYEPDTGQAWNAVVIGSVEGGSVDLVLTYLNGTDEIASRLTGTYDAISQSIKGDLIKVSNGQILGRGLFEAMWINPDISSYTSAVVQKQEAAPSAAIYEPQSAAAPLAASETALPTSTSESYFHDVRQDADRILTGVGDISQIPIGMGGSGLA